MKALVTARTAPEHMLPKTEFSPMCDQILNEAKALCGRAAGVCYATDNWESLGKKPQDSDNRFMGCIKKGHFSIMEHYNVSIIFENVSKFQAMILNSVQIYSTSERSGRYTPMTGNSDIEIELYQKWLKIFLERINEENPDIKPDTAVTRAQENARYVLSIFTHSTNLYYTANLRQWNSLLNMLRSMYKYVDSNRDKFDEFFYDNCISDLSDLIHYLEVNIEVAGAEADEVTCQNMFIELCDNHVMKEHSEDDDFYNDMYSHTYKTSSVQLAHAQRHRAIKYFIHSDFKVDEFYVPLIIRGTEFEDEWLSDLTSIKSVIPQAALLKVTEMGFVGDFLKKCRHRLCGRAQLETMKQTADTLTKLRNDGNFSSSIQREVESYYNDGKLKTKCENGFSCKEPCNKLGVSGKPLDRSI